ncbi:MAG TPA: YncE family protein, partial [Bryobacteraceae bacterium]|nr:YncE family protein [Bryobacteraceae bacterium]
ATKSVIANVTAGSGPAGIAVSPNGQFVYVVNSHGNSVSVIATSTNTVVASIPVGAVPLAVAFTPDGSSAYVTNQSSRTLSVIDTTTNTVVNTISLGTDSPQYLAMAQPPNGNLLYVSTSNGPVYLLSTVNDNILTTILVPGNTTGMALTPDGNHLYVDVATLDGNYSMSVIDTSHSRVVATILENQGDAPGELAISPDGSFAYVAGAGSGVLSIISTARNTRVNGIPIELSTANPPNPGAPVFEPVPSADPSVTRVSVHPLSVAGGASVEGYVVLSAAAPSGGVIVSLSSNSASAVVPTSVTVPAGSKTASFSVMTQPVTSATSVFIAGVRNNTTLAALSITPSGTVTLSSVSADEESIPGGGTGSGLVRLDSPAPAGGTVVSLWTNGAPAFVPASVTVPAGSIWSRFPVTTNYTTTTVPDTITAFLNGKTATTTITVTAPPTLASVSVSPASVSSYGTATGTAALTEAAPPGGALVYLWTNGSPAFVPVSVTIPAGAKTATFPVATEYTTITRADTITAFLNGLSATTTITVTAPPSLASVSVSPLSVQGSGPATGTVTLTTPAPSGGTVVYLWTGGSPAFVPVSVTVAAGYTTATFPVTTNYVATPTQGTITAFYNGQNVTTTITVTP